MFKDYYGWIAISAIVGVIVSNFIIKKKEGKDWIYAVYFIVTLSIGAFLYSFAFNYNNDADTLSYPFNLVLILRSLAYSLKSFGGDFYVSLFSKLARENKIYFAAVIVHFVAAIFLAFLFVVKYFCKNLINELRVFFISWFGKYIVIGCNGQAVIFLKNLESKQRTIVVIQSDQIDKKKELIDKGFAVVTIKEIKDGKNDIMEVYSGALKRAGAMRCMFKTIVISMSKEDETNLLVAKIMADYINGLVEPKMKADRDTLTKEQQDKIIKKQEKIISGIKLDVRIMYSFLERAEHFSYIGKTFGKIKFFNPFEIRARKFLWENPITKLIPRHWIDFNKAKLNNNYKINNIFVGFGYTNKAIFKKSIAHNQLLDIDYNALIISQDAKIQEKIFKNNAIGLFDKMEILPNTEYLTSPSEKNIIVFKEANALTVELYDIIINEIKGNQNNEPEIPNYSTVIIALGEDKLSIETALELRQKLYEYDLISGGTEGNKYNRVRIFVKINKETIMADKNILNNAATEVNCKIKTFGVDDEILTEEYIIDEKLDTLAKNISNRYEGSIEITTSASEWNKTTQHKRESNRYAAMAVPIKLNLLGFDLREIEKDDIDDCSGKFHEKYGTKTAFVLRAQRKRLENRIKQARIKEDEEGIAIPDEIIKLDIKDEIIDLVERNSEEFFDNARNNLARLEHQRWNAFHLANNWTKLPKGKITAGRFGRQNEAAKQHACITTFKGLVDLRNIQNKKEEEIEDNKKRYIKAESLLNFDTIRHDFNTMDFLLDLSGENLARMREAEGDSKKEYKGILTDSGYYICELSEQGEHNNE
jgi:hypothetical protein